MEGEGKRKGRQEEKGKGSEREEEGKNAGIRNGEGWEAKLVEKKLFSTLMFR